MKKDKILQKTKYIFHFILFIVSFSLFIYGCLSFYTQRNIHLTYSENKLKESEMTLENPYRGFYYDYTLDSNNIDIDKENSLIRLNILLDDFVDGYISQDLINKINTVLDTCKTKNDEVIFHPTYTKNITSSRITQHYNQLINCVNPHYKNVYIFQCSLNLNEDETRQVVKELSNKLNQNIFVTVKSPNQIRSILQNKEAVTYNTHIASEQGRLGMFNENMMSNDTDSGIYGTTKYHVNNSNWNEKGTRQQELDYQEKLSQFIPNGGIVTNNNSYNDAKNALSILQKTEISYLSSQSDASVLDKWKKENVYSKIENQLGYRYTITSSKLEYKGFISDNAKLIVSIKNSGFSPYYRVLNGKLILRNEQTKKLYKFPISQSISQLGSQNSGAFTIELPYKKIKKGCYKVFLSYTDTYTKKQIHFANIGYENKNAVCLGKIFVR